MLGSHKKSATNKRYSLQKTKEYFSKPTTEKKNIQYCNKQKIQSTKDKGKTLEIRWLKCYNRKKKQTIRYYNKQNHADNAAGKEQSTKGVTQNWVYCNRTKNTKANEYKLKNIKNNENWTTNGLDIEYNGKE